MSDAQTPRRGTRRRLATRLFLGAISLVVVAVLVGAVALSVPSVRERLLHEVLTRADAALPGDWEIAEARWPTLGHVAATRIRWEDAGETLLALDDLDVDVDLGALWRRDVRVRRVRADSVSLDLPAIFARFGADSSSAPPAEGKGRRAWFPREGAVPFLPSVAVDTLSVTAPRVRLTEERTLVDVVLEGSAELRAGHAPAIALTALQLWVPTDSVIVTSGSATWDPRSPLALNADVRGELAPGLPFLVRGSSDESGAFDVTVDLDADRKPLLALRGTLRRVDDGVDGAAGTATIELPDSAELRRVPALRAWIERAPDFSEAGVTATGDVSWNDGARGDVRVELRPGAWIRHGSGRIAFSPGEIACDSVNVEVEGLALVGHWTRHAGRDSAHVTATVEGADWLRPFVAPESLPQALAATLVADLRGRTDAPELDASLDASATVGERVLDVIALRIVGGIDLAEGMRAAFATRSQGWLVRGASVVSADADGVVRATITPLHVERSAAGIRARDLDPTRAAADGGSLHWDGATATVERLRVEGDLGRVDASGQWHEGRGPFEVRASWREPPRELRARLGADSTAVAARWAAAGPFDVVVRGELDRTPQGDAAVRAKAAVNLPGPWVLASGDDGRPELEGMESFRGTVDGSWAPSGGRVTIDGGDTTWIDELRVVVSGNAEAWRADTALIRAPGFELVASGGVAGDTLGVAGSLAVLGDGILARFVPQLAQAGSALSLASDFVVGGSPTAPTVDAPLSASVALPTFEVPRLTGHLRASAGHFELEWRADEPIRTTWGRWDRVELSASANPGDDEGTWQGGVSLRVEGDESGGELQATWVRATEEVRLDVATLSARFEGGDLAARSPFRASYRPESKAVALHDVHLAGSLGTVDAELLTSPNETNVELFLDLDVGERPWLPSVPAGLWPRRLQARATGSAAESLVVHVTAEGLRIGPEENTTLHAELHEAARGTTAALRLVSGGRTLLTADGRVPWALERNPLRVAATDDELDLRVTIDRFPLPAVLENPIFAPGYLDRGATPRAPRLAGSARVVGDPRVPEGVLRGVITFPGYDELSGYSVGIAAGASQGGSIPALGAGADSSADVPVSLEGMEPGFAARLSATRERREILGADLALPFDGAWSDTPAEEHVVRFRAHSDGLPLEDLTPLIHQLQGLDGHVRLDVSAEGPLGNPGLEGSVDLDDVEIRLRDRSWATARGGVKFGGTGRAPELSGRVSVLAGRIQIPEASPNLLPTEGTALLWAGEEEFAVEPPTEAVLEAVGASATDEPTVDADSVRVPPENATMLDVTVAIPSGVWLRGRGLEVELGGELQILRAGTEISLVGSLDAQRGSMQYLGRRLEIEKGTVTFYGSTDLNPTLDLWLAKQKSGVTVRVIITGTLERPRLELRSEPDMPQADIFAFLLFDRTSESLSSQETQRLSERARATAEQFAANRLTDQLGQELGVDVLRYEQSASDTLQARTVTVGKYVNPDLLVTYEQSLESKSGIGLVVEYFLGHGLRLEMRSRRQEQDGFVLGWQRQF